MVNMEVMQQVEMYPQIVAGQGRAGHGQPSGSDSGQDGIDDSTDDAVETENTYAMTKAWSET